MVLTKLLPLLMSWSFFCNASNNSFEISKTFFIKCNVSAKLKLSIRSIIPSTPPLASLIYTSSFNISRTPVAEFYINIKLTKVAKCKFQWESASHLQLVSWFKHFPLTISSFYNASLTLIHCISWSMKFCLQYPQTTFIKVDIQLKRMKTSRWSLTIAIDVSCNWWAK